MGTDTGNSKINFSLDCPFNAFTLGIVEDQLNHLMGQILTVIDASTDGDKNKAIKDLVKEKFSIKHDLFFKQSLRHQEQEGSGHSPRDIWEDGLVPYDSSKKYDFEN